MTNYDIVRPTFGEDMRFRDAKAEAGLPVRAQRHRVAWLRIADAFPELEIWLVNVDEHKYKSTTWREWANTNYRRQTSQAFLA